MDTLAVVRSIRQAEALSDQGRHPEAIELLASALRSAALADDQRELLQRKLAVLRKRQELADRTQTRVTTHEGAVQAMELGTATEVHPRLSEHRRSLRDTEVVPDDIVMVPAVSDTTVILQPRHEPPAADTDRPLVHDSTVRPAVATGNSAKLAELAESLPEDDLRRELALEVVRLRTELEQSRRTSPPHLPPVEPLDDPDSAVVVHMPGRDENVAELQVLGRRKRPKEPATARPSDSLARAREYLNAAPAAAAWRRPALLWLLTLAVIGAIVWAVYVMTAGNGAAPTVTIIAEESVGALRLGAAADEAAAPGANPELRTTDTGWLIQAQGAPGEQTVAAIIVPLSGLDDPALARIRIEFGTRSMALDRGTGVEDILKALGQSDRPYSPELFRSRQWSSLYYDDPAGRSVLEFRFNTSTPGRAHAIRLFDAAAAPAFPDLP